MPKRIYIFEGPSGSGKTTFIKTLSNMNLIQEVESPVELQRPRAYMDSDNGVRRSSLKDMIFYWSAITQPSLLPLAIDRGFISQLVYGTIRQGGDKLPSLAALRSHIETLTHYITYDLVFRGAEPQPELPIIKYVFYLPLPHVINERRAHATNRTYTYDSQQEHYLYSQAFLQLDNMTSFYISDTYSEKQFIEGELHVPSLVV